MKLTISPDQYEHYESIILTGQMSVADAVALLRDNPEFDEWYRARMKARRAKTGGATSKLTDDEIVELASREAALGPDKAGGA